MENNNTQTNFGGQNPGAPPANNLVFAILATILCCLPLGIYAIVKASEVNGKWISGDYEGAQKSADEAKKWSIIAAVSGIVVWVLYIVVYVVILGGAIAASGATY